MAVFWLRVPRLELTKTNLTHHYYNRPQIEPEGKNNRLTGKQIARAYQRAMQLFEERLQKKNLTAAEAETFVKQARAAGSISSVEGAASEYAAQKQARADWIEQEEAADAAFVQEMLTAQQPPNPAFDMAKWKQQDYAESARWEPPQPIRLIGRGSGRSRSKTPGGRRQATGCSRRSFSRCSRPVRLLSKLDAPAKDDSQPPPENWWEGIKECTTQIRLRAGDFRCLSRQSLSAVLICS